MPQEILEIAKQFMRDPAIILDKKEELTLDGVKQFFISIAQEDHKLQTLIELLENEEIPQTIIYCNKKKTLIEL